MGGEGTVKIDWSRYNSILCKLGFDGSFRELICSHGFEPTFECESLVGLYLPYEKHPYGTEDLLSDLKPYVEPGSWFRWEYEDGAVEIEDFGNPELLARKIKENERWAQMPDEELFDTLNDLDGRYCVTEDQETIGERLNAFFKSGELFEKIYPVVVSENNMESFAKAGITFDRYLDMLITYRVELMQMNDGIGTIRLQDNHLETFGISRQKIRKAAFANLEGIVDFMTLRDDASGFKMIAVARKDKQFGGAAAMLLPSVRRRLAEIFGTDSLVFLPSSISEVIAVPQTAGEPEMLLAMVHEINETEVALEERLTDSIYPMCLADGEYRLSGIRPR